VVAALLVALLSGAHTQWIKGPPPLTRTSVGTRTIRALEEVAADPYATDGESALRHRPCGHETGRKAFDSVRAETL
jgi:hypothetical protein